MVAPLLTMCFLVAYAFMTISCFTLTWLRSPAWRPAGIHRIVGSSACQLCQSLLAGCLVCYCVTLFAVFLFRVWLCAGWRLMILMTVLVLMFLLLSYACDAPEGRAKCDVTKKGVTAI